MPDLWMDVDAALSEVPVNIYPLTDDTDFKSRETGIVYNQAGMDLVWNFVTPAGAYTQTAVTPTTAGDYDWAHQGDGMYSIEIPASGGASINNDTEGFGWFTGYCTGVLPWRGPIIGFRASGLNDLLVESAYSATRGLAGTALPAAAADAAGGLPISDAGGLDLDNFVETALQGYGLDHLLSAAVTGADIADNSIFAYLVSASVTADWDDFVNTTDSLQALRDHIGDGTNLTEAGGNGDHLTEAGGDGDHLTEAGGTGDQLTAVPWNAAWDAEVESECNDALVAIHLDHLLAVDYDPGSKPGTATALLNELVENDGGVSRFTANALEQAPSGGATAQEIWEYNIAAIATAGYAGDYLNGLTPTRAGYLDELSAANIPNDIDALTTQIGTAGDGLTGIPWNAAWDAEVQSECNDALVAIHLDHLLAVDYDPASKPGTATALLNELVEDDSGVSRFTTNALENAPSGAGSTAYFVDGAVIQDADNNLNWTARCLKNGQPENGTNCTATLYVSVGDGTVTAVAGATETVAADDAQNVFNGQITVELTPGSHYYLHISMTADGDTREGIINLGIPVRTD